MQGPQGPTGPTGPAGSANATGTTNTLALFTGTNTLGNSDVTDDGTQVTVGVRLRDPVALRIGNETGTTDGPNYPALGPGGVVVRRTMSGASLPTATCSPGSVPAGSVVARSRYAQLIRDGSDGGFQVQGIGGSNDGSCGGMCYSLTCHGVNTSGGMVSKHVTFGTGNPGTAVTVFTDAENMASFHCTFGHWTPYFSNTAPELTVVDLARSTAGCTGTNDPRWYGFITSTYNQ